MEYQVGDLVLVRLSSLDPHNELHKGPYASRSRRDEEEIC